ncbi:hypothetical protein VCSRO104_3625 [Vibrio cholerae]|nr:hypothetical protein VCSRO104_3625 [Vibrio cholerae]
METVLNMIDQRIDELKKQEANQSEDIRILNASYYRGAVTELERLRAKISTSIKEHLCE